MNLNFLLRISVIILQDMPASIQKLFIGHATVSKNIIQAQLELNAAPLTHYDVSHHLHTGPNSSLVPRLSCELGGQPVRVRLC